MGENPFYFEILKIFLDIWMSTRIYKGRPGAAQPGAPNFQSAKFI